ncbi:NAD(P)-dependent oxidoreductase [Marivita sp. GX14005]|uniref:NAD-dependent epimerase/dehydratase family protein n=1 Tax=Marivita sp. GX14005 TaxID=2942276 RepID=UPI0020185352|nr:NAD(P)-dependent oxidoreductase [Marivita sp. GX14005]MCL3881775.1 NAD(P)-dependent oxidoreductase [Marivita sp. GX14005]
MGDVKRLLITGASGFIGSRTVAAAMVVGCEVVAVQRMVGESRQHISHAPIDLTAPDARERLTEAMAGCDAVIHLAAAMSNDAAAHESLTLGSTRALLGAMEDAHVGHLTLASSIAVFDTARIPPGGALSDDCPLVDPVFPRDAYSGAKLAQENMARAAPLDSLAILRPGIVYDTGRLMNAHLGPAVGPALLRYGANDRLPMCHVDRCAAALVQAALARTSGCYAVLDRVLPTRDQVISNMQKDGWPRIVFPLPWQLLRGAGMVAGLWKARPGLLRKDVLRHRAVPMRFRMTTPAASRDWPNPAPDWGGRS